MLIGLAWALPMTQLDWGTQNELPVSAALCISGELGDRNFEDGLSV